MKKNDLIAKLQSIKGNPQIIIWNGFVDDYQNIGNIEELFLYKEDLNFRVDIINLQRQKDNRPVMTQGEIANLKKIIDKEGYEFPNQFVKSSEYKRWYGKNKKRIVCIEPKVRGKSTFDRAGDIYY